MPAFNEDTGEDVVCVFCGSPDYWDCGHLVADIDLTFAENHGGALFEREDEFKDVLSDKLIPILRDGRTPNLSNYEGDLQDLLKTASVEKYIEDGEEEHELVLDGYAFSRLLVTLLEGEGADQPEGSIIDPGGPGMTSSVALLFSKEPNRVVDNALQSLISLLK